ncbi:MAG: hypothetical protein CL919_07510 [Deltaproteobacteria bacterium]|nr:hypothetical protein [Deltaproteobacteria bacterium]
MSDFLVVCFRDLGTVRLDTFPAFATIDLAATSRRDVAVTPQVDHGKGAVVVGFQNEPLHRQGFLDVGAQPPELLGGFREDEGKLVPKHQLWRVDAVNLQADVGAPVVRRGPHGTGGHAQQPNVLGLQPFAQPEQILLRITVEALELLKFQHAPDTLIFNHLEVGILLQRRQHKTFAQGLVVARKPSDKLSGRKGDVRRPRLILHRRVGVRLLQVKFALRCRAEVVLRLFLTASRQQQGEQGTGEHKGSP